MGLSRDGFTLPLVNALSYLPFGPVAQIQFGNGQALTKAWDQNYWPDAVNGDVLDYDFSTNEVGNIVTVASASEGTHHLNYDRLDRLQEVRDSNLALIEAYTYDATGNRLSQQLGTQAATSYSYPSTSHRLSAVGAAARGYDAVGNTLTGVPGYEADSASYDARNRLVQVGSPSAQLLANYNGRGERVLASQGAPAPALPTTSAAWTTSAGVRGYVYDESGQVLSTLIAGNPLRYEEIVWIDNIPVGRVLSSTSAVLEVHAIHSDHLNTPRALANAQAQGGQAAGTVVWRWKLNSVSATGSNAFGAQPADENPDGNGTTLRFDLRFPGQQWDAAVGVSYNYFRDYEPGTGRYVESDPIGLGGGNSTYGYVTASPLLFFDPFGKQANSCCGSDVNQTESGGFSLDVQHYVNTALEALSAPVAAPVAIAIMNKSNIDMRNDWTIGNDKYFHCVGNCEAARGAGMCAARAAADFREDFQDFISRHNEDRAEDEFANAIGRGGASGLGSCRQECAMFIVPGINPVYLP